MSNAINTSRLEELQVEIDGEELFYDKEVGYYTTYFRTVDSDLGDSYVTEVIINVLKEQDTPDLLKGVNKVSIEDHKEDGATFTINQN